MTTGDNNDSMRRGMRSEGHPSVGQYAFAADERVSVASVGSVEILMAVSTARCSNSLYSSRRRDSHQCCYLVNM